MIGRLAEDEGVVSDKDRVQIRQIARAGGRT